MERPELIRNLIQAASQLVDWQPWKQFSNFDCLGLSLPALNENMLAIVMGQGGDEFGLTLFRGPAAASSVAAMVDPQGMGDDTLPDADLLGFSMSRFVDLPEEDQALYRQTGMIPRYDQSVPQFIAKPPGCRSRFPHDTELALLLPVLRGVTQAHRQQLLKPAPFDDECGICILTLTGPPDSPHVSASRAPWPQPAPPPPFPLKTAELAGLPHLETTWLTGLLPLPSGIQNDDRVVLLLILVEEDSERLIQARPVMSDQFNQAPQGIIDVFLGRGPDRQKGLPREIRFTSRKLYAALNPALAPLGITCLYQPDQPMLREIAVNFIAGMESSLETDNKKRRTKKTPPMPLPAPDDLAAWKAVDKELSELFADYLDKDALWSSRPATQYFGDPDVEYYFEEHRERAVVAAYTSWGVLHYRPAKTSKTYAEKLLAKGPPDALAILLRALLDSYPSLYRVTRHDPHAGTVELEDILLTGTVVVHDRMMSENITDGLFLAARVFPAGNFHFLEPAGPPLGTGMGLEAVEFLQNVDVEFTPEGLRRAAHKFGWLWDWSDEWMNLNKSIRLANMDGDEMLWHTASFTLTNMAETRRALLARPDIEPEDDDAFTWLQKRGRAAKTMGGPVDLGHIEFVGDELVLTVNSAQRFAKARRWLEKLPGVTFQNVATRQWNEAEKDQPLDERISPPEPVEITPDLAQALHEMLHKQYLAWLDTSLPVLQGQTPRQACRTPAGRQKVALLIRTMPDPVGPIPLQVPRQELLQALGLADPNSPPSAAPISDSLSTPPSPFPAASEKIGRNDPCPCGSGKKYKKCCGR